MIAARGRREGGSPINNWAKYAIHCAMLLLLLRPWPYIHEHIFQWPRANHDHLNFVWNPNCNFLLLLLLKCKRRNVHMHQPVDQIWKKWLQMHYRNPTGIELLAMLKKLLDIQRHFWAYAGCSVMKWPMLQCIYGNWLEPIIHYWKRLSKFAMFRFFFVSLFFSFLLSCFFLSRNRCFSFLLIFLSLF